MRVTRTRLVLGLGLLALVWFLFFDSYSVMQRLQWHHELRELEATNAHLEAEIERLDSLLYEGISDDVVERIAREQYSMHRPGETVYLAPTE